MTKTKSIAASFAFAALLLGATATSASAGDYVCKGESVEKSGSTIYTVRSSGGDYTVEKSGSTLGKAVKGDKRYSVEVSGDTLAVIREGKIEKSGSTWATVDEAKKVFDCPDVVAATLWVLQKSGKL
jgi:hypothetical protein